MDKFSTPINEVSLSEDLKELLSGQDKLEEIEGPSQRVISNILNYSKVLSVRKSKYLTQLEFILN